MEDNINDRDTTMSSKQLEMIWLWTTPSMVSFLKLTYALTANFNEYF